MGSNRISPTLPSSSRQPPLGSLSGVRSKRSLICIRNVPLSNLKKKKERKRFLLLLERNIFPLDTPPDHQVVLLCPLYLLIYWILYIGSILRFRLCLGKDASFRNREKTTEEEILSSRFRSWNRAYLPLLTGKGDAHTFRNRSRAHLEEVVVSQVNVASSATTWIYLLSLSLSLSERDKIKWS